MSLFDKDLLKSLSCLTAEVHEVHKAISKLCARVCEAQAQNDTNLILKRIDEMETRIMATQAELTADLKAVLAQQIKTQGEIATVQASVDTLNAKIVELEAIIAAGGSGVSQELIDAVAAVKAQAQVIDDQIPDVVPPPAP